MDNIEQQARELLAAEYERDGQTAISGWVRAGLRDQTPCFRAIVRALECEHACRADFGGEAVCSCPSGDGSLRWPCAQHPPVDANPICRTNNAGRRWKLVPAELLELLREALVHVPEPTGSNIKRKAALVDYRARVTAMLAAAPDFDGAAAVDEAMAEEANERAAIAAYEKHMGVSVDDPAYGPDLAQWMAGWNAALAGQQQGGAE